MEIVTIEKKTFEEMKERFNKFSEHCNSCVHDTARRKR